MIMKMSQSFAQSLGFELVKEIANRRGSFVWKVAKDGHFFAMKGCDPDIQDTYDRQRLIRRETAILRELGSLAGNQYADSGEDAIYGAWLLLRWIDGQTASEVSKEIRTSGHVDAWRKLIPWFISIAKTYAQIHEVGFLHGDVQTQHIFFEERTGEIVILDWGLAQRVGDSSFPYKGGFVHYAAPEIALGMLECREAIDYGVAAEIYSLGALFHLMYTGETAVDYGSGHLAQTPFQDKLKAVSQGRLRTFPDSDDVDEVRMQDVIKRCLLKDSSSRFGSVRELSQAFRSVLA